MSGDALQSTHPSPLFNVYAIWFEGNLISCILYGMYLIIAGTNLYLLHKKRRKILLSYTTVQLVFTALYFAVSVYTGPQICLAILGIGDSYGPDALSPWPIVIYDTMFVMNTWASDGFLLYRCYVVCMGNVYALAVPALLYLVTFGASVALLVFSSIPGAVYSTPSVQVAGLCYWTCSAALNVCASTLISVQFWLHRRAMIRAMGPGFNRDTFYLGYMAMTLESALLYTVFALIALVMFVLNSPLETAFFPVLGMVQVIAPSLIVYRIAHGISLETKLGTDIANSLRFAVSAHGRQKSDMWSFHLEPEIIGSSDGTICASREECIGSDWSARQCRGDKQEV